MTLNHVQHTLTVQPHEVLSPVARERVLAITVVARRQIDGSTVYYLDDLEAEELYRRLRKGQERS